MGGFITDAQIPKYSLVGSLKIKGILIKPETIKFTFYLHSEIHKTHV